MELRPSVFFLLTSLVLSCTECNSTSRHARRHRNTRHENQAVMASEFSQRVTELASWTCSTPRPRLIYEGNARMSEPNAQWIPPVAILHRCEQATGCCSNHPRFSCRPTNVTTVSLVFHRLDMIHNVATYERLSFTNHTACACLSNEEARS